MPQEWRSRILDPVGMKQRREEYFSFARRMGPSVFRPDGTYQPQTERDGRIAYWILPAFLSSPDEADRDFGNRIYAAAAGWNVYDVFMTSCTAANLVRHGREMTPELQRRSEEHLARFSLGENGRKPGAAIYDYMFHGYNDNMPSMATRTLLLAGDILGRSDMTDAGLFHLEGLCAHLERRGLLSEYTSGTYTPISLVSMLDIAELSANRDAREMAQACANRILLDILCHWHWDVGGLGCSMSRAYTADNTETLSIVNAYIWYISGHPLAVNPIEALTDRNFAGVVHHERNAGFNLAQFVEVMNASHEGVPDAIVQFVRRERPYPFEIAATTDWSEAGLHGGGGSRGCVTRAWQQRLWGLGTCSETSTGAATGQQLVFHGVLSRTPQPSSWKDRVAFWHRLLADEPDQGDPVTQHGPSPHAGAFAADRARENAAPQDGPAPEHSHVNDWGRYQTVQKGGTVLGLGAISPLLDGKTVRHLRFSMLFTARLAQPDEMWEDSVRLSSWDGQAAPKAWHFLRYGDVYVGIRLTAMVRRQPCRVLRVLKNGYLRVEAQIVEDRPVTITPEFREWAEYGYVFEIADREEAGSFEQFRAQVSKCAWEYYHSFHRNSRYIGRNGELQISDSVMGGTARFRAVDGRSEMPTLFSATGLDPALARLFPDGRRIRQRRISYRPDWVGSPYYDRYWQVLEADIPGPG